MTNRTLSDIPDMEQGLRTAGVSLETFFAAAEINRATWQRWRTKAFEPRMRTWHRACRAYDELAGKSGHSAEAPNLDGHLKIS